LVLEKENEDDIKKYEKAVNKGKKLYPI